MLIAQNFDQIQTGAFPSLPLSTTTPASIIGKILPYIFGAAAIALLIYLVLGGLQMMTSQGEPKAMQSAQAKITNALLGFVIVLVAFFIVQLLERIFGLQNTFFGLTFL
jgi:ABC-type Na+ efflux pump permease subunit